MGDYKDILETLALELENEITNLISKQTKKLKHSQILYHYTGLDGFKAIIENCSFHFSNSAYLNDKEEFKLGKNIFENIAPLILNEITNSKLNENGVKNLISEKHKNILNLLTPKISETEKSENYVACFSLVSDLLSQWRAYANDGKGVCIGFDLNGMKNILLDADSFNMIYNKDIQINIGSEILRTCLSFYLKKEKIISQYLPDDLFDEIIANEIYKQILKYIGQLKHNAFDEEAEYRFEIRINDDIKNEKEIQFRNSKNNLLVPFINEKLENEIFPIKEIIIGPSLDFGLNELSIIRFLNKNGYKPYETTTRKGILVKKSNVPYRI